MNSTPDLTIRLLRLIGSPLEPVAAARAKGEESPELLDYANRNKLRLLYLESLMKHRQLDKLGIEYTQEKLKYQAFLSGLGRASETLRRYNIRHAIFKSLRPYPAVPSDVDVIILDEAAMYKEAITALLKSNYSPLLSHLVDSASLASEEDYAAAAEKLTRPTWEKDHISPSGSTFVDNESGVHVDLQTDIAASFVTYLDKDCFQTQLAMANLPGNSTITALTPEMELVSVIAHSLMERSFRLGEFYTILFTLLQMDRHQVKALIKLARQNELGAALKATCSLTAHLHRAAFNSLPAPLEYILAETGLNSREIKAFKANGLAAPHRYCLPTMAEVFLGKLRENKFRKGVGTQLVKMLNPRVAKMVTAELGRMGKE